MRGRLKIVLILSAIVAATLSCDNKDKVLKLPFLDVDTQNWSTPQQDLRDTRELAKQMHEGSMAALRMGKEVYEAYCANCHTAGRNGAPKIEEMGIWSDRAALDTEKLVRSVVKGIGSMPPKGGHPDLTEERIRATVYYMVNQSR